MFRTTSILYGVTVGFTVMHGSVHGQTLYAPCTVEAEFMPDVPIMQRPYELRTTYAVNMPDSTIESVTSAIETLTNVLGQTLEDYLYDTRNVETIREGR